MLKKLTRQCLTIVTLLLITHYVCAEDKELDSKLRRLLAQSNFTEQIYQFPNVMKSSIAQIHEMGLCTEDELDTINQAIKLTIKPKNINQTLHNDLKTKITESNIDSIVKWYNSPIGKKISKLELKASDPDIYADMKSMSEELFKNEERVNLAKKLDAITNATDWSVNIEIQSKITMFSALAQIQHKNITQALVQFASQLEQQKIEARPKVEHSILLWYLYAFRTLSDDEIKEYIRFMNKRNTKKFNITALDSLAFAITKVTEDFLGVIGGISKASSK